MSLKLEAILLQESWRQPAGPGGLGQRYRHRSSLRENRARSAPPHRAPRPRGGQGWGQGCGSARPASSLAPLPSPAVQFVSTEQNVESCPFLGSCAEPPARCAPLRRVPISPAAGGWDGSGRPCTSVLRKPLRLAVFPRKVGFPESLSDAWKPAKRLSPSISWRPVTGAAPRAQDSVPWHTSRLGNVTRARAAFSRHGVLAVRDELLAPGPGVPSCSLTSPFPGTCKHCQALGLQWPCLLSVRYLLVVRYKYCVLERGTGHLFITSFNSIPIIGSLRRSARWLWQLSCPANDTLSRLKAGRAEQSSLRRAPRSWAEHQAGWEWCLCWFGHSFTTKPTCNKTVPFLIQMHSSFNLEAVTTALVALLWDQCGAFCSCLKRWLCFAWLYKILIDQVVMDREHKTF